MKTNGNYICPICEKGTMRIWTERTGPRGNRMTDWHYSNQTCDCKIYGSDNILMAIESFKNDKIIKKKMCENCGEKESTIHNPIRAWLGEYEDICTDCFRNAIEK